MAAIEERNWKAREKSSHWPKLLQFKYHRRRPREINVKVWLGAAFYNRGSPLLRIVVKPRKRFITAQFCKTTVHFSFRDHFLWHQFFLRLVSTFSKAYRHILISFYHSMDHCRCLTATKIERERNISSIFYLHVICIKSENIHTHTHIHIFTMLL